MQRMKLVVTSAVINVRDEGPIFKRRSGFHEHEATWLKRETISKRWSSRQAFDGMHRPNIGRSLWCASMLC